MFKGFFFVALPSSEHRIHPRKLFTLPHLEGFFFLFFPSLRWSKTASLALVGSIAQSLRRRWWGFIRVLRVEGRRQDAVRGWERIEGKKEKRKKRIDALGKKKEATVSISSGLVAAALRFPSCASFWLGSPRFDWLN